MGKLEENIKKYKDYAQHAQLTLKFETVRGFRWFYRVRGPRGTRSYVSSYDPPPSSRIRQSLPLFSFLRLNLSPASVFASVYLYTQFPSIPLDSVSSNRSTHFETHRKEPRGAECRRGTYNFVSSQTVYYYFTNELIRICEYCHGSHKDFSLRDIYFHARWGKVKKTRSRWKNFFRESYKRGNRNCRFLPLTFSSFVLSTNSFFYFYSLTNSFFYV